MENTKVKKPIYKRWWFILIVAVVVISAIGTAGKGNDKTAANTPASQEASEASEPTSTENDSTDTSADSKAPDVVQYAAGVYKVGSEIPAGLYKVETDTFMNLAYFERLKDSNMNFESIIANITFNNNGYVRISDTDAYFKIQGATIYPFDIQSAEPNYSDEYGDGIFLVGVDIAPGEYKVSVSDSTTGIGYLERLKDVTGEFSSIIANSVFENQAYVTVDASDFAIKIQGCTLVKSN